MIVTGTLPMPTRPVREAHPAEDPRPISNARLAILIVIGPLVMEVIFRLLGHGSPFVGADGIIYVPAR